MVKNVSIKSLWILMKEVYLFYLISQWINLNWYYVNWVWLEVFRIENVNVKWIGWIDDIWELYGFNLQGVLCKNKQKCCRNFYKKKNEVIW